MLVKISPHLKKLSETSKAVEKQFYPSEEENKFSEKALVDPLLEDISSPVKGICHKYPSRLLVELTLDCAAFCRFCTRKRKVSDLAKGKITKQDISKMAEYIKSKPKVNEIVFSGGDPLMVPDLLIYAMKEFLKMPQIKIVRVHTRIPISSPNLLTKKILDSFSKIKNKALYVSLHFEHPDEFTPQTIAAIKKIKKTGAVLLSQSVFLKGINDSYEILEKLFTKLSELGIRPYYIYHCDLVRGSEHFIVDIKKEVEIMTKLRENISGVSFPFHIIDTPSGYGKIPVPLDLWGFDKNSFTDFRNKKIAMY